MTEKSPKPHNFWLVQFLHHAKGSKKRSSSTRLALAAQIFFQFFQRHFLQFTRRRKDGNKNEKRMRSWMAPWTLAAAPTAQPPTCKSGNNPVVRAHKMPWHRQGKRKEEKNKTCEPDGLSPGKQKEARRTCELDGFVDRQLGI